VTSLVDANVIAELRKGRRANANVRSWFHSLDPEAIRVSVVTLGEIRRVIESIRRRDGGEAAALERWLLRLIADHPERILPVDLQTAEEWGRLNVPKPLPVIDSLLAATARMHGLTLATRNVKELASTGVDLVNPFDRR
jgi:toxin FitB